jgi:hypothetical protein
LFFYTFHFQPLGQEMQTSHPTMANILSLKSKKREPYATSPLVPAFAASATLANTAGRSDAGQALAGRWCASCHLVAPEQGQASADVPTFQLIANSLGKLDRLEGLSADPHPRPWPSASRARKSKISWRIVSH